MLTIIDYKTGNVGSIANMLRKLGSINTITDKSEQISRATKIILPGVGSFDKGMAKLSELNLLEVLNYKIKIEKIPVLGICLGFQLLGNSSEEGSMKGLGWINAKTIRIDPKSNTNLKVPHMGWNSVNLVGNSSLFKGLEDFNKFYFVHSYKLIASDQSIVAAQCNYGSIFTAAIEQENITGVQFHPEKSHKYGLQLLSNFLKYY